MRGAMPTLGETFDRELPDLFGCKRTGETASARSGGQIFGPRGKRTAKTHPTRDILAYELSARTRDISLAGAAILPTKGADALRLIDEAIKRDRNFAGYGLVLGLHAELFWVWLR